MKRKAIYLTVLFLVLTATPRWGFSDDTRWVAAGAGMGISTFDSHQYLEQYQVYGIYRLPPKLQGPRDWIFETGLNMTAGALSSGGHNGFTASAGPRIGLVKPGGRFSPFVGGSLVLLERNKYGRIDFGGPLQFLIYLGLNFRITRHLCAEYQFQHMSNAHIYSSNPGMEMHMIQVGFSF